jgi:hypothetical protein
VATQRSYHVVGADSLRGAGRGLLLDTRRDNQFGEHTVALHSLGLTRLSSLIVLLLHFLAYWRSLLLKGIPHLLGELSVIVTILVLISLQLGLTSVGRRQLASHSSLLVLLL